MTPDEHDRFIEEDIKNNEPKTTTAEWVLTAIYFGLGLAGVVCFIIALFQG